MALLLRRILVWTGMVAMSLVLSFSLTACSSAAGGLSGNYAEDTVAVAEQILATIDLPQDNASRGTAETEARELITSYMSRYRPRNDINGLASFTTMQTALNSLAGHYASYANRPLPEPLRARLEKELKKAEVSVQRGA